MSVTSRLHMHVPGDWTLDEMLRVKFHLKYLFRMESRGRSRIKGNYWL